MLVAARAAGIQAIDGPHLGTRDDDAFRAGVAHARTLGFDGKWAIHPAQLDALREAFTPTEDEVADAREVLAALERAAADGAGAVAAGDRMLDEALALSARRVLARAGARRDDAAPPWFEDLEVGTVFDAAPALTLTEGHAALHQAIAGDRLRLALDRTLGEAVAGRGRAGRAPGARVGRGDRPVDGGDRARGGEPLLPRAAAAPRGAPRRHAAHDDRGRRAAREPRQGGAPADRAGAAADPHRRPGRPARCSTSRAARCCRCAARRPASRATRSAAPPTSTHEPLRGRRRRARPRRLPRRGARAALRRRARRLGGRDRGRRRRRLRAGARAPDAQRRDGPPRRDLDRATAAGSSTAGTRSGSPPRRRRARCRRS